MHKTAREKRSEFFEGTVLIRRSFYVDLNELFFSRKKTFLYDFSTSSLTPPMMPNDSPKVPQTFWKNFIFDPQNFLGTCPEHVQNMCLILSYDVI